MTDLCPARALGFVGKCLAASGGCDRIIAGRGCATKKGNTTMDIGDYFDDLEAHEGCCQWLYCDSRGFVTVGIGNLVASAVSPSWPPNGIGTTPRRAESGRAEEMPLSQ